MPGLVEVGDQGLAVFLQHLGAHRHPQHHVVAVGAVAVAAHAVAAGAGLEVLLVAEVDQGVEAFHRLDPDVAAAPAVAAVRAADRMNFSRRNDTAPPPPSPERM